MALRRWYKFGSSQPSQPSMWVIFKVSWYSIVKVHQRMVKDYGMRCLSLFPGLRTFFLENTEPVQLPYFEVPTLSFFINYAVV